MHPIVRPLETFCLGLQCFRSYDVVAVVVFGGFCSQLSQQVKMVCAPQEAAPRRCSWQAAAEEAARPFQQQEAAAQRGGTRFGALGQ